MYYSLISQFRGALFGSYIGEALDFNRCGYQQNPQQYDVFKLSIEGLINSNLLTVENWIVYQQQLWSELNSTEGLPLQLVFNFIPTVLLFHDSPVRLRQVLVSAINNSGYNATIQDGILAVAYTISQSLTQKLYIDKIIPQTIDFIGQTTTDLPSSLLQVSNLIGSNKSLEEVGINLTSYHKLTQTIATAFYCFLSTTEDFQASILRSHLLSDPLQGLSAIVGALSGAHNNIIGIPSKWLSGHLPVKSTVTNGLTDYFQMLELADVLMAIWSGACKLMPYSRQTNEPLQIIANARAMGLR
ncbi:MAG: ADP-ribosylglycohydrolase family protein [Cyanobacteria bacterium P01_A01_bin.84]